MLIVDACLAVFPPKIRKTNCSSTKNTHITHITHIHLTSLRKSGISDYTQPCIYIYYIYMCVCVCVCVRACVCVCMCVMVWFVSVRVSSNITSVTHTHILRQKHADRRHPAHTVTHLQLNTTPCHVHIHTHTHTHTHTFHSWRKSDVSCEWPARREKCLDKLKTHVHTHTHTRAHTQTQTYRHTTEHFQPTMLTLYSFPEPFYLHAGQVKQHFPVEHHRQARLGGFRATVMSMQGWIPFKNWTLIKIQSQI